ncbi:chemotaxis protein [Faunimonas sp. B44]|uniref:chemotaxis protein n=1 Tax=Faunimonas sp. B44 TaxID=3461493 RepID=UPI004044C076
MIGPLRGVAAAVAMFAAISAPAFAEGDEPYRMVRTLQALQDGIAAGDPAAQEAQQEQIAGIGQAFAAAGEGAWQDPRNARAAVVYVLSGGRPDPLRSLVRREDYGIAPALVRGALAFAEGRSEEAKAAFATLDPRTLPQSLGGQVALVHGLLAIGADSTEADRLLDLARLLMPGTLVEEAALRRQAMLAADAQDYERFAALSERYFRRFAQSLYAGGFLRQFAAAAAQFEFDTFSAGPMPLPRLLSEMEPDTRRAAALAIARAALVAGSVRVTSLAAGQASAISAPNTREGASGTLYQAAVHLLTDAEEAERRLQGMPDRLLAPADRVLHRAALSLSRRIMEWPVGEEAGGLPETTGVEGETGLLRRGRTVLAEADALLAGAR